jgi:putative NIF3 family GTP cyclohydrolase 1 type 2
MNSSYLFSRPLFMLPLTEIAGFLNTYLQVSDFPNDLNGIYRSSDRLVSRIGLALDPFSGLEQWVDDYSLDAVWLHRPQKLQLTPALTRAYIGVLAYHLPFDERLTLGYNPILAEALGLINAEPFGEKEGRPIGMIADIPAIDFNDFRTQIAREFGGEEQAFTGKKAQLQRIAIVGAMTEELVGQAIQRRADVYVTGQLPKEGKTVALHSGLALIGVGHQRGEQWGLRALATILRNRWEKLKVVVYADPVPSVAR